MSLDKHIGTLCMFIDEMNKQVKEENDKQQGEMDKYHINDYTNPKKMQKYTNIS